VAAGSAQSAANTEMGTARASATSTIMLRSTQASVTVL
jgi:hypothetical protein